MGRNMQVERQAGKGAKAGPAPGPDGLKAKRHSTPEERRAAVEAFERSGLTQPMFARQWGFLHVTLGGWVQRHRTAGPKGLERLSDSAPRRRGKAPPRRCAKGLADLGARRGLDAPRSGRLHSRRGPRSNR